MELPFLTHPVITLNKELLFGAGVSLSDERLIEISGAGRNGKQMRLGKYDTIKKDLLDFISLPPYNTVFKPGMDMDWLNDEIDMCEFPIGVLETLKYFKEMDPHTYRHQLTVFALAGLVARDLMPDKGNIMRLAMSGPVHDIGKICVPLEILQKKTPLTKEEREVLNNHSAAGYVLMSYYSNGHDTIGPVVARDHHERRDGSGKPTQKRLINILVEIIAVCDIYDALISPRPYRPISYDNRSALEELIVQGSQGIISMEIVKILVAHNRQKRPIDYRFPISLEKRGNVPKGNIYGLTSD